jgi:CBS domain-containing protein
MEVPVKVGEAMNKDCKLVHANDTIEHAAKLMAKEEVGWLPVQDGDRLVGMITDRDIVTRCLAQGRGASCRVRDAMTHDVKYCFEDEDLDHTLENMAEIQLRRIPVMSRNKRLVGVLTLADAARSHDPAAIGAAFCAVVEPGGDHAGDQMRH